tara:strand:+ start:629 stop:1045 length:417 start_codon:yes stop_codon:yes gene_type:complete
MEILKNNIFFKGLDRLVYWSKLFAILMIISGGLMGIVAIFSLFGFSALDELGYGAGMGALMFFLYGIFAVFYIVPATWLLNFSNKTRKGINEKDESEFAEGFRNFGRYYTFWGICSIVILSIYALAMLIGIIGLFANI